MSSRVIVLVALLALVSRVASAEEIVSTGPLALRAPGDLVLGRDTTARIRLARPASGTVRLVTSAGVVGEIEDEAGGLAATLTLPRQRWPQVAIVAAVGEGGLVIDWLGIPLHGQAQVKLRTEPQATVIVRVGETELPPVTADGSGMARVQVVVPPGVEKAVAVATDEAGNTRTSALALGARSFRRALAVCSEAGDTVTVLAVDRAGAPSDGAGLKVTASRGVLGAQVVVAKGVVTAAVDLRGETGGEMEITAAFADDAALASTCRARLPQAPPVAAAPAAVPEVDVRDLPPAPLTDSRRALSLGARVGWLDNLGKVSAPIGAIELRWRLPIRPVLGGSVFAGVELNHYAADVREMLPSGGEEVSASIAMTPVLARAGWTIAPLGPSSHVDLYTGLGAGLVITSTEVSSSVGGASVDRGAAFALEAFGGASWRLGRNWLVVEAAWLHTRLDGAIHGTAGGLVFTAGFGRDL